MSTAVGFQRGDGEGGREGEASERESRGEPERMGSNSRQKSSLSPFTTCLTTVPAVILFYTALFGDFPLSAFRLSLSFGEKQ